MESQEERNAPDVLSASENTGDDSANLASPGSNQQSNLTSPGESQSLSPTEDKDCAALVPAAEQEAAEVTIADEDITEEMLWDVADQSLEDVLEGKSPPHGTSSDKAQAGVAPQASPHAAPGSHTAQVTPYRSQGHAHTREHRS